MPGDAPRSLDPAKLHAPLARLLRPLVRLLIRQGQDGSVAQGVIAALGEHPRHEFWADSVSYREVPLRGIIGHRQVTDAYLAQLARAQQAKLVSFDKGLAGKLAKPNAAYNSCFNRTLRCAQVATS